MTGALAVLLMQKFMELVGAWLLKNWQRYVIEVARREY